MKAHLERILVVDDDPKIRVILQRMLTQQHYEVMTAQDGAEGVLMARTHHPALIILDVSMPRMDGCRACEALQDHPVTSGIPVLMLSSLTETSEVVEGLERGADAYVGKPFQAEELLARVRSLIERSRYFTYTARRPMT